MNRVKTEMHKPIFEYDNYREFLRDYYEHSKSQNKNFSYRFFSRLLGYSSPIFVKRVIDGTRNLTTDGIQRFAKALKFNRDEIEFFSHLVKLNQSRTDDEKRKHAQAIMQSRVFRKTQPLKEAQFSYYSQWYYVPVRELVGSSGFKEDPAWIAQALNPPITPFQALKALEELERLGLIQRNEKGKLVRTAVNISTPDEILSPFKAEWLRQLIRLGGEAIERIPRNQRDISSVTINVTPEALEKIKELTKRYRREVMELAAESGGPCDDVFQLNIQIFPLSRISNGDDK
jgi:uncharacterized protein (TIGR02147 family)